MGASREDARIRRAGSIVGLVALVLLSATVMVGCGSSTSPAEAEAASVAEQRFLKQWRSAVAAGSARCSGKDHLARCYRAVVIPLQGEAMVEFSDSIESFLDGGVGSECAEALEDAQSAMSSVPSFAGEASAVCSAESGQ